MDESPPSSGCGHEMDPRVRLDEAAVAIEDQKRQRVIRIVATLRQQGPTELTLHGHQLERWLDRVTPDPTGPGTAEMAKTIEHHHASVILDRIPQSIHEVLPRVGWCLRDAQGLGWTPSSFSALCASWRHGRGLKDATARDLEARVAPEAVTNLTVFTAFSRCLDRVTPTSYTPEATRLVFTNGGIEPESAFDWCGAPR